MSAWGVWMTVELVIFDCDGVLIDSEAISAEMLIATLDGHGISVDLDYVSRHFLGRSYPTVLNQIRGEFGVVLPDNFESQYRKRLLDSFRRNLRITPGVKDVIDSLAVRFCVATSSSPERVSVSLDLVGLTSRLHDCIFTASEVRNGKPAPDLFLYAATQMGVAVENCLVIEDSLNGIRAGLAAGMEVWRFTGGSHIRDSGHPDPVSREAHFAFSDFADFFDHAPALKRTRN